MCQVRFHAFSAKSDQGSQRTPKGIPVYVKFLIPPSLVISQVKKKSAKITVSSISPYSQHFIFSLLPTFSPRFLPPPYSVPAPSFCQLKENKSDPRNNDPLFNQPQFKCNTFCYVAIIVSKRFLLLFPRSERERGWVGEKPRKSGLVMSCSPSKRCAFFSHENKKMKTPLRLCAHSKIRLWKIETIFTGVCRFCYLICGSLSIF